MNIDYYSRYFLVCTFLFSLILPARADEVPWGPKIIQLEDITISCEAYNKYYRDIVEDAAKNNSPKWNAAADWRLDEAFGTYKTAWIKSPDWIMDMYGKKLPTHKSIHDIECYTRYNGSSNHGSGHNDWDSKHGSHIEKKHTYDKIRLGYIDECKIKVTQDIWIELGECGTGTIVRNFEIGVWCDSHEYTFKLSQKIHVIPSCTFSRDLIYVPDVQWMCAPIDYVDNNHINLPDHIELVKFYDGWEESTCLSSKVYVSYSDHHYKLIQQERQYVIIRTWVFTDKCTGKKIEVEQKIMVDGLCRDDEEPNTPDEPDEPDEPDDDSVQFTLLNGLNDIYISHTTYLDTYKDVVELSLESFRNGQTELSARLLNAIFGEYEIQCSNAKADSVTVYSMECNNGNPIDSEFRISNGLIQADCPEKVTIEQTLSEVFTNCGASGLERQFIVASNCDSVVMRDTFVQQIVFSPTCALSDALFDVPPDTVLCGRVTRDENNQVVLPVNDQPQYLGDSMRSFEVEYKFLISYSSDDPDRTNVNRIWTYTDTCLNDTIMVNQELIFMDTCQSSLEKTMSREIVHTLSKENIEWGISDAVKNSEIEVNSTESIEPFVYPNPFTQSVGVNFYQVDKGRTHIRIMDSRGQLIFQKGIDVEAGIQQVSFSSALFKAPGMYVVQLISGDHIENLRVMYQPD